MDVDGGRTGREEEEEGKVSGGGGEMEEDFNGKKKRRKCESKKGKVDGRGKMEGRVVDGSVCVKGRERGYRDGGE